MPWLKVFVFGSLGILFFCNQAQAFWPFDTRKSYSIEGIDTDEDTKEFLESVLASRFAQEIKTDSDDEKAATIDYQEKMAQEDLSRAMKAQGYYSAKVSFADDTYTIEAGKRSVISSVEVTPPSYKNDLGADALKVGDPLLAENVLQTQSTLQNNIQKDSCMFNLSVQHKAVLNPKTMQAKIVYEVNAGKEAVFNGVTFTGMEDVKESYLHKLVPWKEGECFRHEKVADLREKLLSSGLFSRAEVTLPQDVDANGAVPITVDVKERAQRSIRAGLSYYTDEGVGSTLGWEHRNFFGSAEKVNADLSLSMLEQSLKATLDKPYFLRKDQNLSFTSEISREDTDAYEQFGAKSGFRISRVFTKRLSGNTGADFELTRITEENQEAKNYGLFSPTGALKYDSRNDTLDPHKGWLASYSVTPFIDVMGESSPFIKNEFSAQHYIPLHDRITFAARLKLGMIAGTQNTDVPATQRFFAGGGGSVRGYGYQEIGPHENGDPVGGRSLIESSAELRFKFTDTIGGVAFIDAGDVGEKPLPSLDNLAIGGGVGARYYTGFGPVRLDVGVPLNNKEELDQNFQVYISIGQAF